MTTAVMSYEELAREVDLPLTDDPEMQMRLLQERRVELLETIRACKDGEPLSWKLARVVNLTVELDLVDGFLVGSGWLLKREEAESA